MVKIHILIVFICFFLPKVKGHGRLIEPPSRATAWKYGFKTPPNYNDHELFCGGFTRQWVQNEGKCGICGDPWDVKLPRPHEYGGTYGEGVIVRKYGISNVITIRVELTASHMGYFQFAICSDYKNASQECLDQNILEAVKPQDEHKGITRYYPKDGNKVYEIRYRLPQKFSCNHCILQWRYLAGNNWGKCENGTEGIGCGPQEEFRACADISITTKGISYEPTTEEEETTVTITTPSTVPNPEESYSPVSAILITLFTFLVISLLLFLLYFHYYQLGRQIKNWVVRRAASNKETNTNTTKSNDTKVTINNNEGLTQAPVAPPRAKRSKSLVDGNMHEIDLRGDRD